MAQADSDILLTPTKKIHLPNGNLLQAIKASDSGFSGFGEAYFSYINYQAIKAWKQHKQYTANFIVPMGKVKVVLYKEITPGQLAAGFPKQIILSDAQAEYQRLTVPPGVWYGFEGLAKETSLIFSFLNGEHSQQEQNSVSLEDFQYKWNLSDD